MAGGNEYRTSAQPKTGATEAETITAGVDGRRSNAGGMSVVEKVIKPESGVRSSIVAEVFAETESIVPPLFVTVLKVLVGMDRKSLLILFR